MLLVIFKRNKGIFHLNFTHNNYTFTKTIEEITKQKNLYPLNHIRDEIFLHGLRAYSRRQIFQNYVKLFDQNFYVEYSAQNIFENFIEISVPAKFVQAL